MPVELAPLAPDEAEVRLAGPLAALVPGGPAFRVRSGQTILQAITALGVPEYQRFIFTVNGHVCAGDYVLASGDRAALFPPIAGG